MTPAQTVIRTILDIEREHARKTKAMRMNLASALRSHATRSNEIAGLISTPQPELAQEFRAHADLFEALAELVA